MSIAASNLAHVYVGIPESVEAVLKAVEKVRVYAPEINYLHKTDGDLLEATRMAAMAVWHAHLVATSPEQDKLRQVADEGYALRSLLMSSARPLIERGELPASAVEGVTNGRGYRALAGDLYILGSVFSGNWEAIEGRTSAKQEEIANANSLCKRIMSQVVARGLPTTDEPPTANEMRQRAFTLFRDRYTAVRKAIAFLLDDPEEVNELVPPLSRVHVHPASRRTPPSVGATPPDAPTDDVSSATVETVDPVVETVDPDGPPPSSAPAVEAPQPSVAEAACAPQRAGSSNGASGPVVPAAG